MPSCSNERRYLSHQLTKNRPTQGDVCNATHALLPIRGCQQHPRGQAVVRSPYVIVKGYE